MSQNLKVCIISKFPPIEGGMSAKAYWLATGLADHDVGVTVLTNANLVEKEYFVENIFSSDFGAVDVRNALYNTI
jgi:hypothetical protein